ncbi:hypothetical protein LFM09_16260 [Lentzea alba]|uniref:hypothetical protein n=1 Tax=Lentzea alba TaxID=2714351 RepID=UPI0039BFF175
MTIGLPPRRELPADIKERMRPDFTEVPSRNHIPLAVAAGVALLIAGGVAITQSVTDNSPEPGRGRVTVPSEQDVNRCRAAMKDETWKSTEMVTFGLYRVLISENGSFCELSGSTAGVVAPGAQPVQLEAGSIAYRSTRFIAGVPPLGALTARAREVSSAASRGATEAVVTPDFFVIHTPSSLNITEMVFDDRTVPVPSGASLPPAVISDSFESGNSDPWTPANIIARCADNAYAQGRSTDELRGWEPLLWTGVDRHEGVLLAHRDRREWATCTFTTRPDALQPHPGLPAAENKPLIVGGSFGSNGFLLAGRTSQAARTVELTTASASPVTADVTDGFFVATLPQVDGLTDPRTIQVTARDAGNQVVYRGPLG